MKPPARRRIRCWARIRPDAEYASFIPETGAVALLLLLAYNKHSPCGINTRRAQSFVFVSEVAMIQFPRTMVGGISLPRLICGSNWMLGFSHTSKAKDRFIKELFDTPDNWCV